MKSAILSLTLLALLTACAPGRSKSDAPASYKKLVVVDVPEYTKAQQKAASIELETYCVFMPITCGLILPDYSVMRDQARVARGQEVDPRR